MRTGSVSTLRSLLPVLLLAWTSAGAGTGVGRRGRSRGRSHRAAGEGVFQRRSFQEFHASRGVHPARFQERLQSFTVGEDTDRQLPASSR